MSKPSCVKDLGLWASWNRWNFLCKVSSHAICLIAAWHWDILHGLRLCTGSSTSCSTFFHYEVDVLHCHFCSFFFSHIVRRCWKLSEVACFDWFLLCRPGEWQLYTTLLQAFSISQQATRSRPSVFLLTCMVSCDIMWPGLILFHLFDQTCQRPPLFHCVYFALLHKDRR